MTIDMESFEDKYHSAKMYHYRANQFLEKKSSASVVFNIASMALENYLIALCELYGVTPGNHNFECLMDAVETVVTISPEMEKEIRSLDLLYGICSLENFHIGIPEEQDANRVLMMCRYVETVFDSERVDLVRSGVLSKA